MGGWVDGRRVRPAVAQLAERWTVEVGSNP